MIGSRVFDIAFAIGFVAYTIPRLVFNKIEIMTIRIPKVKNLLTARPEGMDFETYKRLRKEQKDMLHGWNQTVMEGGKPVRYHYPGRLEGVRIPPEQYTNSRDIEIVIK